jgi:hypothetical protein
VLAIAASLAATLVLPPVAAVAQDSPPIDRIDLPAGWQPEGITSLGETLFVGSLADGAIWRVDSTTAEGSLLVPGRDGAVAVGVEADAAGGRLWVAGGRTGEVRVYDVETGELLGTWTVEAGFLNDLVATPEAVYVTDSFEPQLIVIPLGADGSFSDAEVMTVPITGDLTYGDGFNVNGIVSGVAGLVIVHSPTGALYSIDPATGETATIDTGDAELSAGDGLELDGSTLYVVRNRLNRVAIVELDDEHSSATVIAELSSDDLDIPATAALVGDDLWAVNARFSTNARPKTKYWITRLDTGTSADG